LRTVGSASIDTKKVRSFVIHPLTRQRVNIKPKARKVLIYGCAHSTVKCNTRIFDVVEDLVRGCVSEDLSGAGVEFILDPLDIGM
jgi:hypothetical protein